MLEEVPAPTHRPTRGTRPPARLAAWVAFLAFGAGPVAPGETENEASLAVTFNAPAAPGDSFSLTFPVPANHVAAVLFVDGSAPSAVNAAAPTAADVASGWLVPVPVAPGATTAVLTGAVPTTMTQQELAAANVAIRVLLVDLATMTFWWSDPIALSGAPQAAPSAPTAGAQPMGSSPGAQAQVGASASSSLTAAQAGTPNAQPINSTVATTQSQMGSPPPSASQGTPSSGPNSNKGTGPMSVRFRWMDTGHFHDGSHDQPVPVQGSGH